MGGPFEGVGKLQDNLHPQLPWFRRLLVHPDGTPHADTVERIGDRGFNPHRLAIEGYEIGNRFHLSVYLVAASRSQFRGSSSKNNSV